LKANYIVKGAKEFRQLNQGTLTEGEEGPVQLTSTFRQLVLQKVNKVCITKSK